MHGWSKKFFCTSNDVVYNTIHKLLMNYLQRIQNCIVQFYSLWLASSNFQSPIYVLDLCGVGLGNHCTLKTDYFRKPAIIFHWLPNVSNKCVQIYWFRKTCRGFFNTYSASPSRNPRSLEISEYKFFSLWSHTKTIGEHQRTFDMHCTEWWFLQKVLHSCYPSSKLEPILEDHIAYMSRLLHVSLKPNKFRLHVQDYIVSCHSIYM